MNFKKSNEIIITMKLVAILISMGLSSLGTAFGLSLDLEGLGQNLNGWSAKRTATYTIDSQTYRTHVPTVTPDLEGGLFVSMRVEHLSGQRPDATAYLELSFAPDGSVAAAQIRLTMNGHHYNTGQVTPKERELFEEAGADANGPRKAPSRVVLDLFRELDQQLAKEKGEGQSGTKDLWGRLRRSRLNEADVSAALRHNLNLLLTKVRPE